MLKIANYQMNTVTRRICITASAEWVKEKFEGIGYRLIVRKQSLWEIILRPDPSSRHRWGRHISSAGMRQILIIHDDTRLPLFGAVDIVEENFNILENSELRIILPQSLPKTIVRISKPKLAPLTTPMAPEIKIGDAVAAVNSYKRLIGDELVLSIDKEGFLKALLQYS